MVVICKVTRIAIIYFIQSAPKNENFLFMQDSITQLIL